MDRNNVNFKHIRAALEIRDNEIVDICALGELYISRDRAKRWARSPDAGPGRYSVMNDAEFDAFCAGLREWSRENTG